MDPTEKIIGMIKSPDEGTVRLGATLALGMGPEWCLETFKYLTMNAEENIKKRHNFPVIKAHPALRGTIYVKGGVAIVFYNYVECNYFYRLCNTFGEFAALNKVIVLDEKEE